MIFAKVVSMRKILAFLALFLTIPAFAQTGAIQGWCNLGGKQSTTSGLNSTNYLQGIIPSCTVTVYLTGTTTKATIYADGSNTPLSNPFTANALGGVNPGGWIFWAATNQALDVVMSGGIAPNTYPSPVTIVDLLVAGSTAPGGVVISGTPTVGDVPVATSTTTATWQTLPSGTGVQYSTANLIVSADSIFMDDNSVLGTTISIVSIVCTVSPSICSYTYTAGPTITAGQWLMVKAGTTLSPTGVGGYAAGFGCATVNESCFIKVLATGLSGTTFQSDNPWAVSGSGTGGSLVDATYQAWHYAALMPFLNGHMQVDYITSAASAPTLALLDTNYATLLHPYSPAVTGKPAYLLLDYGNDIASGSTAATYEGHATSVWAKAHTDGYIVIQAVIGPRGGSFPVAVWNTVNSWIVGQGKSNSNLASGQYWDLPLDLWSSMPDPNNTQYYFNSGGDLNPGGALGIAELINRALTFQTGSISPTSQYCWAFNTSASTTTGGNPNCVNPNSANLFTGNNTYNGTSTFNNSTAVTGSSIFTVGSSGNQLAFLSATHGGQIQIRGTATGQLWLTNAGAGSIFSIDPTAVIGFGATAGSNTPDTAWSRVSANVTALGNGTQGNASGTLKVAAILPGVLYSAAGTAIPACTAGLNGETATVTDATAPSYRGAYTSGGTVTTLVQCDGASTTWLTH